jgi:hypothetical protein
VCLPHCGVIGQYMGSRCAKREGDNHNPHPEARAQRASKDGQKLQLCLLPSFETRPSDAPQDEDLANAPPPIRQVRAHPSRRKMERREAPGVCETPLGFPCDRETCAPRTAGFAKARGPVVRMGLRGPSRGARASCGGVAKPATETLRLPALHREPHCRRSAPCPAFRVAS